MKVKMLRLDLLNQMVSVPDFTDAFDLEEEEHLAALERVREAVEALPEPKRTVVEMTVWGQHTRTEVARELMVDPSYVSLLWRQARGDLAEVLRDLGA